jgi:hypothetical protein
MVIATTVFALADVVTDLVTPPPTVKTALPVRVRFTVLTTLTFNSIISVDQQVLTDRSSRVVRRGHIVLKLNIDQVSRCQIVDRHSARVWIFQKELVVGIQRNPIKVGRCNRADIKGLCRGIPLHRQIALSVVPYQGLSVRRSEQSVPELIGAKNRLSLNGFVNQNLAVSIRHLKHDKVLTG